MRKNELEKVSSEGLQQLDEKVSRIEFKLDSLIEILGAFYDVVHQEYIKDDPGKNIK